MRRTRSLSYLVALVTLLTGALVFVPGANADTADLEIANEAWFARFKREDPQANTCLPGGSDLPGETTQTDPVTNGFNSTTTRQCGPFSPADFPAPQSKSTGHYVVASSGGEAGENDGQGDTAWAAFQWDTFEFLGATVEKFEVRLHLGMDRCNADRSLCENQGDTYHGHPQEEVPPIQACNILQGWSGEPGSNPWLVKPKVSDSCIAAKVNPNNRREFVFDVTSMADTWLDGTGHGFVIRPGTPTTRTGIKPFQITFSGYYDPGTESAGCNPVGVPQTGTSDVETPSPTVDPQTVDEDTCTRTPPGVLPKVTFAYTPAPEDEFFEDIDDFDGGDEEIFEDFDTGGDDVLEADPDLDIIPTDVGSEEFAEDLPVDGGEVAPVDEVAAPVVRPRTRNIGNTPFPWAILFLLPFVAVAFWTTGTALGPLGDPVAARRGGVSRVLAERQAVHRGGDFETRNR